MVLQSSFILSDGHFGDLSKEGCQGSHTEGCWCTSIYSVGILLVNIHFRVSCIKAAEGAWILPDKSRYIWSLGTSNYGMNVTSTRFHTYIAVFRIETLFLKIIMCISCYFWPLWVFLAVCGLFSSCGDQGYSPRVRLLTAPASLVEHWLEVHAGFSTCGAWT